MRDVYYWVSGIFIVISIIALYQQYKANVLLNDIKVELSKAVKKGDVDVNAR
jgi:hypothetical protein